MRQPELIETYLRELDALGDEATRFAEAHPSVARHLGIGGSQVVDPHVERLLQGTAFLTARVRLQLDRMLPELGTALLSAIHPAAASPLPALSVARFEPLPEARAPTRVPRHSRIAGTCAGGVCWFRTTSEAIVPAARVVHVAAEDPRWPGSPAAMAIRVRLLSDGPASTALPDRLRFFLDTGPVRAARWLDALLLPGTRVAVEVDGVLGPSVPVRPVGFEPHQAALPHGSSREHTLLLEYFAYPIRFRFFELDTPEGIPADARGVDLVILLPEAVDRAVVPDPTELVLGCAPIVNLYPRTAEPIRLAEPRHEHALVPALGSPHTRVHSIHSVRSWDPATGTAEDLAPLYGAHPVDGERFWTMRRFTDARGPRTALSVVHADGGSATPRDAVLQVGILATDGPLAGKLPAGTELMPDGPLAVSRVAMLQPALGSREALVGGDSVWRLIAFLSSAHVSLGDPELGLAGLRELLSLHCDERDAASAQQIRTIRRLEVHPIVRRIGDDGWRGYCRGLQVVVELDERASVGTSGLLFGALLDRFLPRLSTALGFTELELRSATREGAWRRYPPRNGARVLL